VQGRVVASLHPTLFSPAQGIVSLRTKAGSQVTRGDVLAVIESGDLRSQLTQGESLLVTMRAELDRQRIVARQNELRAGQQVDLLSLRLESAKRALGRYDSMFRQGLGNRAELEAAQDAVRVAQLELEQAAKERDLSRETLTFDLSTREQQVRRQESATAELQRKVDELTVKAPFDGIVASIGVQDRDAVAPNQAVLTVVNLSSFELEIGLPEEYGADTHIGTAAVINFNGQDYSGRVTAISPEVVNAQVIATVAFTGTAPVGLKQSQRLTTRLIYESKSNVLKVTRGAFVESGGGRAAYVVSGQTASRREVVLGDSSATEVEVVSGLREGDRIVTSDTTPFENAREILLR